MGKIFERFKGKLARRSSSTLSKSAACNPLRSYANNPTAPPQINVCDAPPAYSADAPTSYTSSRLSPLSARSASPSPSVESRASRMSADSVTNDSDKYAFLSTFDTIFLIDDSGSMAGRNWREARDALSQITQVCTKRDSDGIDLYFLNNRSPSPARPGKPSGGYYNIKEPSTVESIFNTVRPTSLTPTGTRLRRILKPYMDELERASDIDEVKPVNIIVITDGEPSDDPEATIVQAARKLDKLDAPPYQVGIQFFQVGGLPEARDALRQLDDGLEDMGIRDMVDTATWDEAGGTLSADGILKIVLGAVVRRIDRRRSSGEHSPQ